MTLAVGFLLSGKPECDHFGDFIKESGWQAGSILRKKNRWSTARYISGKETMPEGEGGKPPGIAWSTSPTPFVPLRRAGRSLTEAVLDGDGLHQ